MHHMLGAWQMTPEWDSLLWFLCAAVALACLWALSRVWKHSEPTAHERHR